jgi:hypothetical protein
LKSFSTVTTKNAPTKTIKPPARGHKRGQNKNEVKKNMILYFETAPNANGNKLQLKINTETKEIKKGFCLFGYTADAIKLEKKQLEKLFEQVFDAYVMKEGGRKNEK